VDPTTVVIVLAYLVRMVAGPAHGPWIALLVDTSMVCAALLFLGGLLR
jgi:acyl-coenzyme A thioesterase PaaI-like protein